jgi:hypothetical protein
LNFFARCRLFLEVFLLFEIIFLPRLVEKSFIERLAWIEITFLSGHSLLVLQHLFIQLPDDPELVDVKLSFVLKIFECSKNRDTISNLDILIVEPSSEVVLAISSLTSVVIEIIQPEHTGDDSGCIINSEEMFVIFLDVEHDCASHTDLGEQVLISEDEKYLTCLLILLSKHIMVLDGQVFLPCIRVFC